MVHRNVNETASMRSSKMQQASVQRQIKPAPAAVSCAEPAPFAGLEGHCPECCIRTYQFECVRLKDELKNQMAMTNDVIRQRDSLHERTLSEWTSTADLITRDLLIVLALSIAIVYCVLITNDVSPFAIMPIWLLVFTVMGSLVVGVRFT
jgi:hypothetical protein